MRRFGGPGSPGRAGWDRFPRLMAVRVGVPKETAEGEHRVALVPEVVRKLVAKGVEVTVEPGAGARALIPDTAYQEAGATLGSDVWSADVVAVVAPPSEAHIAGLHAQQVLVGFLALDLVKGHILTEDRAYFSHLVHTLGPDGAPPAGA